MNTTSPLFRGEIASRFEEILLAETLQAATKKSPAKASTGHKCGPPSTPKPKPSGDTTGDKCSQPTTPKPCKPPLETTGNKCSQPTTPKPCKAPVKKMRADGFLPADQGWSLPPQPNA